MKAVVIERPHEMHLTEKEIPVPEPGFARIRVAACALCATDLEVIDGRIPAKYPLTPGHEWSGVVDAVGSEKDREWIGKRVIGSNDVVCMTCDACRSGNWRYCSRFEEIGFKRDGAYAEYVNVPVYGLCEIEDMLPFEVASLCEPLGVALGTLEKSGARIGDTLTILGAGSIGLCILATAKAMGLRRIAVCASGRGRLGIAKQMGAHTVIAAEEQDPEDVIRKLHPGGSDVVIDATGIESCIQKSLRLARKGGTVVLAGYGRGKTMAIRTDDVHINNLHLIGAGNNWNMHKRAAALMQEHIVDLSLLVTEVMPLEDYARAVELARTRPAGFVKAVFRP